MESLNWTQECFRAKIYIQNYIGNKDSYIIVTFSIHKSMFGLHTS